MIDIKQLRQEPDRFREACRKKRIDVDIDRALMLDTERRRLQSDTEELRGEVKSASKTIGKLPPEQRDKQINIMKEKKTRLKTLEAEYSAKQKECDDYMLRVPNPPHEEVPEGADENDNVCIRTWGEPRSFEFACRDHLSLMEEHDMVDIQRASEKISGSRTYYLKGEGVLLEQAVLQYTLHKLVEKGFTPFSVPTIVNYEAMTGTSYFPGGEDQAYHLDERDDMYLIGTSEVPLTAYHMNEILSDDELPKTYCGISPCYRREAGTYGKDTRGLYRIHQFQKIEQVIVCRNDAEESARMHEMILGNAEEVLRDLGLAYRVVVVCSGDMGQGQVIKHDIETWMPSRDSYGETHSCSTFHDFQARRLKMRYKDSQNQICYCHTLNNTCIASPRILIPLIEVYQNKNGTITIPDVLTGYFNGRNVIGGQ